MSGGLFWGATPGGVVRIGERKVTVCGGGKVVER